MPLGKGANHVIHLPSTLVPVDEERGREAVSSSEIFQIVADDAVQIEDFSPRSK